MYLWNIESLKKDIVNDSFTDKELMPYVVLYLGLYALNVEITAYLPYEEIDIWTYLMSFLNLLIPVVGIIYAYKCNGGGNGKHFASKYFSIGFVIGVRFLVYLIPIMVIMAIYWAIAFEEQEELPTTFLEIILFSSWNALYYLRVAKHIRETVKT